MKINHVVVLLALGLLFSCSSTAPITSYGPIKVEAAAPLSVQEMLTDYTLKKELAKEYTFKAPIHQVCSKAGCWVNIDKGNGEMFMVRFKDHFTIPTKTKPGTWAVFHGTAYQETVSVEMLRHFAEDAGESEAEIQKITKPKITLTFEADGVTLLGKVKK